MFPKPKTYRSKKYLDFIRSKPCITCGSHDTFPHHEAMGCAGKGIKAPDSYTLPMCAKCHRFRHDTGFSFWDEQNIDVKMEIIKLLTEYLQVKGL